MEFHHIGIATSDISLSAIAYEKFGYKLSTEIFYDPLQNVNIAFMEKLNSPVLELISPFNSTSPIMNILKKNGTMPYHICFEVADIENEVDRLKKMKYRLVTNIVPAIAFNNRLVCFLYNKDSGLIELLKK